MAPTAPIARIPHTATITLLIRPWLLSDVPATAKHANNAKIAANMTERYPFPYRESDAEWWVRRHQDPANWGSAPTFSTVTAEDGTTTKVVEGKGKAAPLAYAIALVHHAPRSSSMDAESSEGAELEGEGETGEVVGGIGITLHTDVQRRSAEIGYWVAEEFWGRGIMSLVLPVFIQWAWTTFPGLIRLVAEVFEGNMGSERVLTKAGFQWEGRLRRAIWKWGRVQDLIVFGLLRE